MTDKQAAPAIGIDLGTTFSVLAYIDDTGHPISLANAEGERITPSAVLFDGDDVIVGKEALKAISTEAPRVAEGSKRDVGQRIYRKTLDGKQYPPEVIEAFILNKLRTDGVAQLGDFTKAVITVPAYFDEVRRKATQDAGYMAGLDVLDIINEPTAAAVAFGHLQGFLRPEEAARKTQRFLVYDLGGGTFDVTVMEVRGRAFITLATDGDVQLGGYEWDQRLVDLVAEQFIRQYSLDPREDPSAAGRLWRECEDAKRTLSARSKAAATCDFRGKSARVEISREQFEEGCRDLVDRTRFTTVQTLSAAGLEWGDLDRVLLVGGSTRMPMIHQMLKEVSGTTPDSSVAADEAVAHGAALRARLLLDRMNGRPSTFQIKNVNSHSLGVVGTDPQTGRPRTGVVIPRNTPLPVTAKRTFRTKKADQRSILVQVVEGESPTPDDCLQIGRCSVPNLPRHLPMGTPIDVLFDYKSDGRLGVHVSVADTDVQIEAAFTRENSLSKEHLDGWRSYISGAEPTEYR
ncbi:MAG: Hsp70 family protein [Planctomycetaceae bacterium]|nr:Hsp70 family protein [Planctomycetaceae bacterium]